ncbi:MAG: sodium:solute symporter [Clostridia bacterium]|nr:sodium:solute symporter [Clostridia bacterium]
MVVKITCIVVFAAVTVLIGIISSKKVRGVGDFVLGGRNVGPWFSAFAFGTSYFSAVIFVGYAGRFGWNFGVSATWIGLANALIGSCLAWVVLGRRTRVMTKHLNTSTMPEFFEKRYNSKALKLVAALIIFIFLVPYSASIYKGLSGIFHMAFNIPFEYCIIGMALLTAVYVILGGYVAAALNDFIQGIVMLIGISVVVYKVLAGQGGFTAALAKLSAQTAETSGGTLNGAFTSFFGPAPLQLVAVMILTSLGTWGLPQMVHKFYSISDEKAIRKGTIISTLFAVVVAGGSYFMGGFGRLYVTATEAGAPESGFDGVVPAMLSGTLSDLMIGIIVVLVLSASMSTLSSLVISSSSTVTLDLIKGFFAPKMSEKKQMWIIRICCAFFIGLSVVLAMDKGSLISNLMAISWGALAGAFLAPFMYGLFSKRVTKAAVWVSFACGVGLVTSNLIFKFMDSSMAAALAMVGTLVIVPLVSLITPKLKKEHVEECFSCYNERVEASVTHSLTDI